MATTRIWKVENNLQRLINYAGNTHKTLNPDWENALHRVMDYAADGLKTEQKFYVTGINCLPDTVLQQMQLTKERYCKTGGILAFHAYQSFAPGEVSAELAHQVGVELAEKVWGNRFEVIVATHLNTGCFHNHFVLNSVSFMDGLRYCDNKTTYALLRRTSDEICREYGLSVIERPGGKGRQYAEWQAERSGNPTWRTAIREDIDIAIMGSTTWRHFVENLQKRSYRLDFRHKHPRILPPGFTHYARLDNLGAQYTPNAIERRIMRNQHRVHPPSPDPVKSRRCKAIGDFRLSKVTWKGLRALYFFYLHKLRQAAKQPTGYAPFVLREDLRLLERLNRQTRFLFRYQVDTKEDLALCKEAIQKQIDALRRERTNLFNEKRRAGTTDERKKELEEQIKGYTQRLRPLYQDIKLADDIAERSAAMIKNLECIKACREQPTKHKETKGQNTQYDKSHSTGKPERRSRKNDYHR